MSSKWKLLGLYYQQYSPFIENYGIRLIEGYYNIKTGRSKTIVRQTLKSNQAYETEQKIENIERLG